MFFYKISKIFKRPFFKVLLIAGIGWIFDFLIYITLLNFIDNIYLSNLCGNIFGLCFTFVFGLKIGFNNKSNSKLYFMLIYMVITLIGANGLSLLLDFIVNAGILNYIIAKIFLIIPSYLFNYFTLKCINYLIVKKNLKVPNGKK